MKRAITIIQACSNNSAYRLVLSMHEKINWKVMYANGVYTDTIFIR